MLYKFLNLLTLKLIFFSRDSLNSKSFFKSLSPGYNYLVGLCNRLKEKAGIALEDFFGNAHGCHYALFSDCRRQLSVQGAFCSEFRGSQDLLSFKYLKKLIGSFLEHFIFK